MARSHADEVTTGIGGQVFKRVGEALGHRGVKSERDLVEAVESRLATETIEALLRFGVRDEEIYAIVLPRRTLAHRRSRRERLSREESDRLVRLARIVALAEEVFGDRERAFRWLRTAKRQFQGRDPLHLAATEVGARLVEELLYRIDDGMAA